MISRSTLIGALVVVELGIAGIAAQAVAGGKTFTPAAPSFGSPFADGAGASDRLHRAFAAGPSPHVVIDTSGVDVVVRGSDVATVRADETLERSGWVTGTYPGLSGQQSLDTVRISRTAPPSNHFIIGSVRHQLSVTVPAMARVEFVNSGDIEVSGLRSKLVAHSDSGTIYVHDHRGDVDVSGDDGRITMVDVQGATIAATAHDGRIYLTRVGADRIDAASDSGRIVGVDVRAVDGGLTTHDGRIVLSLTGSSDTNVRAHAEDDDLHIRGLPVERKDGDSEVIRLGTGRGHFEVSAAGGPITITPGASI